MRAIFQFTTTALLLAICAATASAENQMPWQKNLETAQRLAAQSNRLVLIHFWAPWCRPCMRMEQEVFSKPETAKGLESNFVVVKLNADEAPGTARLYGVSSLPSDVITTPSGRLVSQLQSPPTASQYVQQMNQAAAGHRALARRVSDASADTPAAAPGAPGTQPAAGAGMTQDPYSAPPAAAVAGPSTPPAGQSPNLQGTDPYAEYFPNGQAAPPSAPAGQVTPAQAYAAVPSSAPATQGAPLHDPYAQAPAAAPPVAAPAANPYAANTPPAANPYATNGANPYAPPSNQPPVGTNPYAQPPAAQPPTAMNPYAAAPPTGQPIAQPPAAQTAANPYAAPPSQVTQASLAPQVQLPPIPAGCPPLALDGNCPVTLVERKRWAVGHPTFGAVHRGRTYLFLGPQEREKFLAEPDRYAPVMSGLDPVMAIDNHSSVPGKREFGVFGADGKIYLFANEASRAQFEQNEQHYTAAASQATQQPTYQAMRPGP